MFVFILVLICFVLSIVLFDLVNDGLPAWSWGINRNRASYSKPAETPAKRPEHPSCGKIARREFS